MRGGAVILQRRPHWDNVIDTVDESSFMLSSVEIIKLILLGLLLE
jgi:hypothetical protein